MMVKKTQRMVNICLTWGFLGGAPKKQVTWVWLSSAVTTCLEPLNPLQVGPRVVDYIHLQEAW